MTNWQPIDQRTPRDRSILAWSPDWESEQRVKWHDGDCDCPDGFWFFLESALSQIEGEAYPTHWLDIPVPPGGDQ